MSPGPERLLPSTASLGRSSSPAGDTAASPSQTASAPVVAHRLGQPDLRLPHASEPRSPRPCQKQNHRPGFAVVAAELLRQVNLKAVSNAVLCSMVRLRKPVSCCRLRVVRPRREAPAPARAQLPRRTQAGSRNRRSRSIRKSHLTILTGRGALAGAGLPAGWSRLSGREEIFILDCISPE